MSFQKVVTNKPVTAGPDFPNPAVVAPGSPGKLATGNEPVDQEPSVEQGEAIRVLDLTKNFRSGFLRRAIRGIEGVSFTVPRGRIFALLGHNGAGKTTTINCILDLVHPDRGQVNILGRPHGDRAVRARVGFLPERPYFFEHLSGLELLRFYAKLQGVEARVRNRHIDELVNKLGIGPYVGRRLKEYSKGMLQRIGIAQALLGDPELLILDEPMSGLDPMGRREIRDLLLDIKEQGRTIILSSHIVPDIERMADTVAIMREGRLAQVTDLAEMAGESSFEVAVEGGPPVIARDVAALRAVLEKSHREGRTVGSIQTCSTGLEDLYLAVHGRGEEVR